MAGLLPRLLCPLESPGDSDEFPTKVMGMMTNCAPDQYSLSNNNLVITLRIGKLSVTNAFMEGDY